MFERYTEAARRALFFARYEASQLGSISIEAEHLLLGLIREPKGVTGRVFALTHVPLEADPKGDREPDDVSGEDRELNRDPVQR